ncbi:DNA repair/transcription protein MET18/MMS19, partial [Phenoliferia sp. Uapishka_3]
MDTATLDRQTSTHSITSQLLRGVEADADKCAAKTLTTFFTDKLSDPPSMASCTTALTHLTTSPTFGVGEGMEVTRGIFTSVLLTSYPQSTRFLIYTLLDSLMSRSRPALKRMGKEFISGYCALVEGEKDPRNLMLSFSIARVILVEFEIAGNVTVSEIWVWDLSGEADVLGFGMR